MDPQTAEFLRGLGFEAGEAVARGRLPVMDPQDAARLWAGVMTAAERRATSAEGQRPLPNAATRFAGVGSRALPLPSPFPNQASEDAYLKRATPLPSPFPNQASEDAAFGKRLEVLYGPPGDDAARVQREHDQRGSRIFDSSLPREERLRAQLADLAAQQAARQEQVMRQRRLARILEQIARSTRESATTKPFTGFAPTGPPDRQRRLARMRGARSADVDDT
jgi:hypothetical protein